MKELSHCIKCLLIDNDCVILPGIGGFIVRYESAMYNSKDNSFISPKRVIGFNGALTMNDGLIIQAYMQIHNLSYPDASRLLEKDLQSINNEIEAKGFFYIEEIGKLIRKNSRTYTLEVSSLDIITPELFALSDLYVHPIESTNAIETSVHAQPNDVKSLNTTQKNSHKEIPTTTNISERHEVYTFSVRRSFVHTACAAVAAVLLFCFISFPLDRSLNKATQASIFYDITRDAPQAIKQTNIANTARTENNTVRKITTATDSEKNRIKDTCNIHASEYVEKHAPYTVVLASDVTEKNAKAFVEGLKSSGFEEAEVYKDKHMLRVIYSRYTSNAEAYKALHSLSTHKFATGAWVMKLK